jgi:hypothetical protein
MTEQNLHDYNKWLMEVWNPNQLYIPFAIDAPKAFLDYQAKQLIIADVVVPKGTLCDHPFDKVTYFMDNSAECECGANLEI